MARGEGKSLPPSDVREGHLHRPDEGGGASVHQGPLPHPPFPNWEAPQPLLVRRSLHSPDWHLGDTIPPQAPRPSGGSAAQWMTAACPSRFGPASLHVAECRRDTEGTDGKTTSGRWKMPVRSTGPVGHICFGPKFLSGGGVCYQQGLPCLVCISWSSWTYCYIFSQHTFNEK